MTFQLHDDVKPSEAEILVIGAGVIGLSTAVALARQGARAVTVVDPVGAGAGTTGAGAGFVAPWAAGLIDSGPGALGLQRFSLDFYRDLADRGHDIGYRANGTIILALSTDDLDAYRSTVLRHPQVSPSTRLLSPAEVGELASVIEPGGVAGGIYLAEGIQVETDRVALALAEEARAAGVRVRTGVAVDGFDVHAARITGVHLSDGESLHPDALVVAAGMWTNEVLAGLGLGLRLPLAGVVATRATSEPFGVDPMTPTIMAAPHSMGFWLREKAGGLIWGAGSAYRSRTVLDAETEFPPPGRPRYAQLLSVLERETQKLEHVFPILRTTPVAQWTQGMPVYTPDGRPLIGGLPRIDNALIIAGDNETGVTHGPAWGEAAAELIVRGTTRFDLTGLDPHRFEGAGDRTERQILDRPERPYRTLWYERPLQHA